MSQAEFLAELQIKVRDREIFPVSAILTMTLDQYKQDPAKWDRTMQFFNKIKRWKS